MPDSIRELIMKDIVTALALITTANGWATNVQSVQRYNQAGQTLSAMPMILVAEGQERGTEGPNPLAEYDLDVWVMVFSRDDGTARSSSEILNEFCADVMQKLQEDPSRGTYAIDTGVPDRDPEDFETKTPHFGTFLTVPVKFRTLRANPRLQA